MGRGESSVHGRGACLGPEDHVNIRVLQHLISGIPFILGLGARMSDSYLDVVFWAPTAAGAVGTPQLSHLHELPPRRGSSQTWVAVQGFSNRLPPRLTRSYPLITKHVAPTNRLSYTWGIYYGGARVVLGGGD